MDNKDYLIILYDYYSMLFTDKQRLYFEEYYFNDLSYGEISEKYSVSRNAIFHQLKLITEKLVFFEEKLQLYVKKQKINDIIKLINDKKVQEELENIL